MTISMMHGYRVASKAMGDDVTLTRHVRRDLNTDAKPRRKNRQPRLPGFETDFIREGRTKFGKQVKAPHEVRRLLVSGHDNVKIGRDVRKGKLRGYWIYTLSLEERKTCPSSCSHCHEIYVRGS